MLSVSSYDENKIVLINKEDTSIPANEVTYDELRKLLMNNAEFEDTVGGYIGFNDYGDIVESNGNILNKAVRIEDTAKNSNLHKAKNEKNDEFYTRLEDIEAELSHYDPNYFKDKVIYCPTDVAINTGRVQQSQFVRYFQMNAHRLQFKKLIATCLVYKAANNTDDDLEQVQNCYILERQEVDNQRKKVYDHSSSVIAEKDNLGIKYVTENGDEYDMPYHIVNQAVTAPEGRFKIARRYFNGYNSETGEILLSKVDTGKTWNYKGYDLKVKWVRIHPSGLEEILPEECYYINDDGTGKDFITDFSVFPKDENGKSCVEVVGNASVCLYPPALYDYVEITSPENWADYEGIVGYSEYRVHCIADNKYVSGDYRSLYCQKLFEEADVVVTNPPFSLFRDFVACLEKHNLKYAIIGNMNAITYKEIFPLLKDNILSTGYNFNVSYAYRTPYGNDLEANRKFVINKGLNPDEYIKVPAICWYTNFDIDKHHEKLILTAQYDPTKYPKYDNYDAIEVSKVKDIPCDYDGIMGVPITFLDKYNPDQFEIIGNSDANVLPDDWRGASETIVKDYYAQGNKGQVSVGWRNVIYYDKDGKVKAPYKRILIKRK